MKRESKAFEVLQKVGKSFFLPISVLPFAGILLGIGASFTNPTNIANLGLGSVIVPGNFLHTLLTIFSNVGNVVFGNLPLLFAMAVALGMANREKAVAALSATLSFLVMNITINSLLIQSGKVLADGSVNPDVPLGTITSVLGIQSLQMGVFGGIVVGLVVAYLHNKYYKIELPATLAFFGGVRFIPIISTAFGIILGIFFNFAWPIIQIGISQLGALVVHSGYVGTFLFGVIERALIPFGLHHAFYTPIWTTGLGGHMEVGGKMVYGAQLIYFAQLADPHTTHFSIDAVRFLVGKFPFMMGGLPGAALAMYHCVPKERREEVKGLYFGAGLTSFLTGITEPIEFTFLFLSPTLFGIHVFCAGISFALCHMLRIAVGTTFSDGLIDFTIFGLLQGTEKTRWPLLVLLMVIYFVVYYFMFKFLIIKWDVKVPGRDENAPAKLFTKDDYQKMKKGENAAYDKDVLSPLIVKGLGGRDNLKDVDCCATRLRVAVLDSEKVNDAVLKQTGASGIIRKGTGIQVIYGPRVSVIKGNLEDYLANTTEDLDINLDDFEQGSAPVEVKDYKEGMKCDMVIPVDGKLMCIDKSTDDGFAQKMMGDGYVIVPSDGNIVAPVSGEVTMVFDTKHAIAIRSLDGDDILIHIGLDTVNMKGEGFNILVKPGDKVTMGQKIAEVDFDKIKAHGYSTEVLVVYPELGDRAKVDVTEGDVKAGEENKIVLEKK